MWNSVTCYTWHSEMSWRACLSITSFTLNTIAWISDRRSEMAAEKVFFISAATVQRSFRLRAEADQAPKERRLCVRNYCGLLLGERDWRVEPCDAGMVSLGRVRNISGVWRLSCMS